MILTAITGSIGCGKTTIAHVLRRQGYLVYDIDKWVKHLYYKKDFLEIIEKYFPQVFDNGVLDKKKLRQLVFDDRTKLKVLESLIHPLLEQRLRKIIRRNRNNGGVVFIDGALLFEMGWDKFCDYVILADLCYDKQKERVIKRDGISAEDFDKINALQMPGEEKLKKVDFVIDTDVTEGGLIRQIIDTVMEIETCKL